MNRMDEMDALKDQDWSKVCGAVDEGVKAGVQFAFARIHAREKRRRLVMRSLAVAACLALVAGMGSIALRRSTDAPDRVAVSAPEAKVLSNDSIVYAARADACFHLHSACSAAMAEQVELQMITALEFEKKLCDVCGVNVQLP